LKDVQRLLLPFPVLGADHDEILPSAPLDTQRSMIFDDSLDRTSEMAPEIVHRHLSHGLDRTINRYDSPCTW
jgi:hypothetical protein